MAQNIGGNFGTVSMNLVNIGITGPEGADAEYFDIGDFTSSLEILGVQSFFLM